jgi:hypothetical protein
MASDMRRLVEQVEREAYERGLREGREAGAREARRLIAHEAPANHERARLQAWVEHADRAGDTAALFKLPAQGWPSDVVDVDRYVEDYIDLHVLGSIAPTPSVSAPEPKPNSNVARLRAMLNREET